jgi:hypothetical protein
MESDRFVSRLFGGLMIGVSVVVGSLGHAVSNMQSYI